MDEICQILDDFVTQDDMKNGFHGIMKGRVWHALKPIGGIHVTINATLFDMHLFLFVWCMFFEIRVCVLVLLELLLPNSLV